MSADDGGRGLRDCESSYSDGTPLDETKQRVTYGVTLVAAFAVGMLVGKSACDSGEQPEPKTKIVTKQAPCRCDTGGAAPDVEAPDTVGEFERESTEAETKQLPEAPPAPDPAARRRLLAWVRDQSPDLSGCRRPGSPEVRLTVTLEIDQEGVRRVNLNAPEDELSADARSCLRERMQAWSAPGDLFDGRKRVVFGLDI